MKEKLFVLLLVLGTAASACGKEGGNLECQFFKPELTVTVPSGPQQLQVWRKHGAPHELLILNYGRLNGDRTKVAAVLLDLTSGTQRETWLPYDGSGRSWPPDGFTIFASGVRAGERHPLIRSGKLRYEYLGKSGTRHFAEWREKYWAVAAEELFTGVRRMMYGTRPLVEQRFRNASMLSDLSRDVQIEPDGDRLVCLCMNNGIETRIAIFSQKRLESEQGPRQAAPAERR